MEVAQFHKALADPKLTHWLPAMSTHTGRGDKVKNDLGHLEQASFANLCSVLLSISSSFYLKVNEPMSSITNRAGWVSFDILMMLIQDSVGMIRGI